MQAKECEDKMDRKEFMKKLEMLLSDIPEKERKDALLYYEEYLDDAGTDNEQEALKSLGTPEKIAAGIRSCFGPSSASQSTQQNRNYHQPNGENPYNGNPYKGNPYNGNPHNTNTHNTSPYRGNPNNAGPGTEGSAARGKQRSTGEIILLVLLCVIALPVLIPVGIGVMAVVFALLTALVVLLAALLITGFAVLAVGLILVGVAVVKLFAAPAAAVYLFGGGLVCTGIGLAMSILMIWLAVKVIPLACQGFVNLCRWPFRRRNV